MRLFVCKCQLLHTHLCVASIIGLCPHMENPRLSRGIFFVSLFRLVDLVPQLLCLRYRVQAVAVPHHKLQMGLGGGGDVHLLHLLS